MNRDEFFANLNESICRADWLKRYYSERARKYSWIDYWLKAVLGVAAVCGAGMAAIGGGFKAYGVVLAAGCAFLLGTVLPGLKWDRIVSGLKEEQRDWTHIYQGFESLKFMAQISDRDEMLMREYEKVEAVRRAAAENDRYLPEDEALRDKIEAEVRKYYELDGNALPVSHDRLR
jgi:hypothetical protein